MSTVITPKTCVVVSYWVARSPRALFKLLRKTQELDAGSPFDLIVVCNGGDLKPLTLPPNLARLGFRVLFRENTGWNLGAWEQGWRSAQGYQFYLFLQDDCILKRPGWISEFEFRAENDPKVGLIGETIMWDQMSWSFVRTATDRDLGRIAWPESEPVHPLDVYKELLTRRGVPIGDVGTHLPTLILFAPRTVLEEIGGFPLIGSTYREAVACEIGISRLIESRGYRLVKIDRESFHLIGHHQWDQRTSVGSMVQAKVRRLVGQLGGRRLKRMLQRGRIGQDSIDYTS